MANSSKVSGTLLMALLVISPSAFARQPQGADARIAQRIEVLTSKRTTYSNVRFHVEDAIVTLEGSVELESQRRTLVGEVKRLPEVAAVHANIVLSPPAVPDEVLYPRVLHRLESLHLAQLRVSVHEGLVTLAGSVRDQHSQQAVLTIAQGTDGVKEVVSQLRIEER